MLTERTLDEPPGMGTADLEEDWKFGGIVGQLAIHQILNDFGCHDL